MAAAGRNDPGRESLDGRREHLRRIRRRPADEEAPGDQHAAVVGHGGEDRVHLIKPDPPHEPPVTVHDVQVADHVRVARCRLKAAGRIEQDVAVGQVDTLVIGITQSVGELPQGAVDEGRDATALS